MSYDEPTAADLKARYSAFAAVEDATIEYWLTDSARYVDTSWSEGDYAVAKIAHAAYEMARGNVAGLAGSDVAGIAASGVTVFKSGAFQAQFSDKAVEQAVAGGYQSNIYGQEFYALLMRRSGGPYVTSPGYVPCGGYPFGWPC